MLKTAGCILASCARPGNPDDTGGMESVSERVYFEGQYFMMEFVYRLLEFIAIVWMVRYILHTLLGNKIHTRTFSQFKAPGPSPRDEQSSEPKVVSGEMKKDPQCGTYVSTELSLKYRYGGEVLHFCSRQCQEQFLQAHSSKPA